VRPARPQSLLVINLVRSPLPQDKFHQSYTFTFFSLISKYPRIKLHIFYVSFEVLTAVTMKNGVFWDVTPCGSCKNRVSEVLSASFIRVTRIVELGTTLAVTSNRGTLRRNTKRESLMKESLSSSETSVLITTTRRNITQNAIFHIF
jgi:hypothetical protein